MMVEELQLISGEETPIRNAIVTFFSFAIFGLLPLIPCIVAKIQNTPVNLDLRLQVCFIGLIFLAVLGVGKSFVASTPWYEASLQTILIGTISASIAFFIGILFNSF